MRRLTATVAALTVIVLTGCAHPKGVGDYFADRGSDFAHCWRMSGGYGLGLHVRARAIILDAGEGFAWGRDFGYDGPAGAQPPAWNKLAASITVPIIFDYDVDVRGLADDAEWKPFLRLRYPEELLPHHLPEADVTWLKSGAMVIGYSYKDISRTLPPWTKVADYFWVQAEATPVFVSVRFGFNPLEFLDWLAGIGFLDPLGDDDFGEDERPAPGAPSMPKTVADGDNPHCVPAIPKDSKGG